MNNSGQSLVEVLIALAMTVLLLTALVIATTQSIKNSRFARTQAQATHLAQIEVEKLRNIRDEQGWKAFLGSGGTETLPKTDGTTFTRTSAINEVPDENYADVIVTVYWEDRGRHEVKQTTILSKWAY